MRKRIRELIHFNKQYAARIKDYFINASDEITRTNLRLLRLSCGILLAFLAFFLITTPLIITGRTPLWQYWFFLSMAVFMTALIFRYAGTPSPKRRDVWALCVLFYVVVYVSRAVIDIFPYPDSPANFTPVITVVLPAVFILPASTLFPLMILLEILYVVLLYFNKTYEYMAFDTFNSLIGLLNRGGCISGIKSKLLKQTPEDNCSLMILDIDYFKDINDKLGHQAGDRVLEQIGRILPGCFRSTDIIGRIGGDEFMVFLPDLSDRDTLNIICDRTENAIRQLSGSIAPLTISCSIGAVTLNGTGDFDQL